ncbi:MAG: TolC family protein [Bacteroidia bacterium]|nr:TolC family protein [Bacteroidia bacterium]
MKNGLLIIMICISGLGSGQLPDSLSLYYCQHQAGINYPLVRQKELLSQAGSIKTADILKNYYPQMTLNAQASYQSDVTKVPLSIPGISIPTPDKDSYKLTADINQLIYGGGYYESQQKAEKISTGLDLQNLEVEMYKLKDWINQLYFSILILQENERQLLSIQDDIKSRLAQVKSAVSNGIMAESNEDVLEAELLQTAEQLTEILFNKKSTADMMASLMGESLPGNVKFIMPAIKSENINGNLRPEFKQFELQEQKSQVMKSVIQSGNMPKVAAFGQLGYGRPGLNMLSDKFGSYYLVGAKVTWSPWDWKLSKNECSVLDLQKEIIGTQKETFEKNLDISTIKEKNDIDRLEDQQKSDIEIIGLRKSVVASYASRLENGIITSSEYLTELNNLKLAELNYSIHRIMKIKAMVNLLNIYGNQ